MAYLSCPKGYYMLASFVWGLAHCERLGRKKISPYFSKKCWSLYGITCSILFHAIGSYATTAFFLRSYENVMENWRSHYFWGHIVCIIFYILVSQLPTPPSSKKSITPGVCMERQNMLGKETMDSVSQTFEEIPIQTPASMHTKNN